MENQTEWKCEYCRGVSTGLKCVHCGAPKPEVTQGWENNFVCTTTAPTSDMIIRREYEMY